MLNEVIVVKLLGLVKRGLIDIDSIKDTAYRSEVVARLAEGGESNVGGL